MEDEGLAEGSEEAYDLLNVAGGVCGDLGGPIFKVGDRGDLADADPADLVVQIGDDLDDLLQPHKNQEEKEAH